ncbi:transposase [Burkholderia cenocepacia]|uniref:transposase n=1 Tax=Burkholderia cenocepacia TaxID=95486 RepID=UPI00285BA76B|nr:transposase [Burkholderia cenocepacia]MDR8032078.1 transposase [Burkholderia cenocepacia]
MTEQPNLRNRLVVGRKRDGRREFDEATRQELVELCLRPGVSIARTAMDHDVNPNQLRKWIASHQQRQLAQSSADAVVADDVPIDIPGPPSPCSSSESPPAFVPVVSAPVRPSPPRSPELLMAIALHVRLPNGVEFDLGKASLDELATIVQMLGRLPCSGSTKS